jgi:hypothetical protein
MSSKMLTWEYFFVSFNAKSLFSEGKFIQDENGNPNFS